MQDKKNIDLKKTKESKLRIERVLLHGILKLQFFLFPFLMQNEYRCRWKASGLNFIYM